MEEIKPFIIERPWGNFRQFTKNENTTVKIISIKPNSSLSLQYHQNREEFWYIISGNPTIIIGENKINAKVGDEFKIAKKEKHQIEAGVDPVQFLEISYGDFNEEDIIRLEDKYGRA